MVPHLDALPHTPPLWFPVPVLPDPPRAWRMVLEPDVRWETLRLLGQIVSSLGSKHLLAFQGKGQAFRPVGDSPRAVPVPAPAQTRAPARFFTKRGCYLNNSQL